jgi:hypothetical protein
MPPLLEGFKIAEEKGISWHRIVGIFTLTAILSFVTAIAANYFIVYDAGAASKAAGYDMDAGRRGFSNLAKYLSTGQSVGAQPLWYLFGGLGLTGVFASMRSRFPWWPLHPAGLALATSTAMNHFWMPVFVAWLLKLLLIRYGGMYAHRKAAPFFLGLVLGDYTVGALWSLLGILLGQPTYRIYV